MKMPHQLRDHLPATSSVPGRTRLIKGRLYAQILTRLEKLKFVERRYRKTSFAERRQHDDDIFSIHPRTLADLKRRDNSSAG